MKHQEPPPMPRPLSWPVGLPSLPLRAWIAWAAIGLALVVAVAAPLPEGERRALALAIGAVALWATAAVPEPITAVFFFAVAMLFAIAPAPVVFGAFTSTAVWLIFGGLVMGVAIRTTGLGERIALRLGRAFGSSYAGVIWGIALVGMVMGFLMPSSIGRAVLLMPIVVGIATRAGFAPGSPGYTGAVLAGAFGCHAPTFAILPANLPNLVMAGGAEGQWHVAMAYAPYLALHFPILGLLKMALMAALILWLWPDTPRARAEEGPHPGPLGGGEVRLSLLLALALALWATDMWHHVNPAWVSLGAAALLLLPRVGLVERKAFVEQVSLAPLLHVAGIMGLGAVVAHSGLGARIAQGFLTILPLTPGDSAGNFASLAALSTGLGLAVTLPGVPAVLTPLAGEMARASGLPVETVLMTQVLGFSNPILPYESAPLVVAMLLGGVGIGPATRLCLWLAGLTVLVLLPLDYLWWRLLGWL